MKGNVKNLKVNEARFLEMVKRGVAVLSTGAIMMSFSGCSTVDIEEMNNADHSFSQTDTDVFEQYSTITDEDIAKLPSSISIVRLNNCHYITSLATLPKTCPNIVYLELSNCSSITDLSFIYSLHNLEGVVLHDICGINYELLDYLNSHGIEYEIDDKDIEANEEIDRILAEIIDDDMDDEEKIRSIVVYTTKLANYRITKGYQSNKHPLSTTLLDKKGVCYGFAYITNVLLRRAGIESYQLTDHNHAWNMVELDGKYYYIDCTNLGGDGLFRKVSATVLKYTGFSLNYLCDPKATSFTAMSDYDEVQNVIIPKSLVEDVERGESEKSILERYGTSIPARILELILIIVALKVGKKKVDDISENIRYEKNHKNSKKSSTRKK